MLTVSTSWYQLGADEGIYDDRELRHGIHAGLGETSIMLAARGELVAMEKAKDFRSRGEDWAEELDFIGVGGGKAKLGWLIQDLNADGACGNAAATSSDCAPASTSVATPAASTRWRSCRAACASTMTAYCGWNSATWRHRASTLELAASATTLKRSRWRRTTSRVLTPMEPVEPSTVTPLIAAAR